MQITRSDSLHLKAAEGWLELGNWREAIEELEQVSFGMKSHAFVLQMRCDIYKRAKKWDFAAEVALHLNERFPTHWRFPYFLACCYAQLGEFGDSKTWLQQAMRLAEKTVKQKAEADDDLKPLWDSMSETMWRWE